jgi:Tfp pilus assembly protein PilE
MNRSARQPGGFTSVELLLVMALSAVILGGAVVSYGTIVRSQPRVSSMVSVPLGASYAQNFYGTNTDTVNVGMAPQYGALSLAEELREQFLADTLSATAVYCLPRDGMNTWKPSTIVYDPTVSGELDTPQKFRAHIIAYAGVSSSLYRDYRNPLNDGSSVPQNASIFVLGYSKYAGYLKVNAIYDIDLIRFTAASQPNGIYASVKRYADAASAAAPTTLTYMGGYDVFFPPSVPNPTSASQWSTDGFTPLFITFERAARLALTESPPTINRFKRAYERPFYFIWWPDPAARHLGPVANTFTSTDPRQAYNHMGGRTGFMFTVPMFPAL